MKNTQQNQEHKENRKSGNEEVQNFRFMPSESERFCAWLTKLIGDESDRSFAKRAGISNSLLSAYKKGERTPGYANLRAIAEAGGVPFEHILFGGKDNYDALVQAQKDLAYLQQQIEELNKDAAPEMAGYVSIDHFLSIGGASRYAMLFKEDWIRTELGANPKDLELINVSGDSMEPTLKHGDIAMIDRSAPVLEREGIYAILMGNTLLVKRVQHLPGGILRIASDNPSYVPLDLRLDGPADASIDILGRVIWSGRRM